MRTLLRNVSLIVPMAVLSFSARAQNGDSLLSRLTQLPLHYAVHRTQTPPRIDGMLDDTVWNKADWTEDFNDIEGNIRPKPKYRTRVKMLWDSAYLYVGAELEEPDVWAYVANHDEVVFRDNDFEVFIDPGGLAKQYFEIETNARATIFDLFLPEPYRNGSGALISWNCDGLKKAVHINGSLNNPKDRDSGWTVEMAIPVSAISIGNEPQTPYSGAVWRINFSRVEWETDKLHGKYVKRTDSLSHRPLPEHNWVWSPQGIINMHFPERWGYLLFEGPAAKDDSLTLSRGFATTSREAIKRKLWEVYYREQLYWDDHKTYTSDTTQLHIPGEQESGFGPVHLDMEATKHVFFATMSNVVTGEQWAIDNMGNIQLMSPSRRGLP
jgi:hypothetical protein